MKKTDTLKKTMVGQVISTGMQNTVKVEVTTFKVHPLYHKRYRWTKKYLSDIGQTTPAMGDTVRIEAAKPMSRLKRWVVAEVVSSPTSLEVKPAKKQAKASTSKKVAKKKA